ncbi:MAG: Xaa-Pro peptidase family protein [Nitrososphaerota archaeon]
MLLELNELMRRRGVGALICIGDSTSCNPELAYLTRARIPRGGVYFKAMDSEPLILVSHLDVNLARQGVVRDVRTFSDMGYDDIVARVGRRRALAELLVKLLKAEKVRGSIALCGYRSALESVNLADTLRRLGFHVLGEQRPTILDIARSTKDEWEVETIRRAGVKTLKVVKLFERLLSELVLRGGVAMYGQRPITVGFLKRQVAVWCAENGLTLNEGLILSVGPKSSDPHHSGSDEDRMVEGQPVILDLFPTDRSGYMYDFTRTYVIGKPSAEVRRMMDVVSHAHAVALDNLGDGISSERPFLSVCRYLGRRGYLTILDLERGVKEAAERGFVHSLGHGVGLTIGEEPYLRYRERSRLRTGMVFTVEPGLYEPDLGGVRIEDVVVLSQKGPEVLVKHPHLTMF